ncbi:MAG TPA: ABC-F family ATP-binding cassette domain-containing protein [Verrucomicrobiales bacterium]|nr:ABC-F family ATP-binding cassette domain-containing protein [Verrucomicrobiales bacterium]
MLQLSNISKAFAGRVLFENVSLQINRGDRVGLVGPNGAGKSTLFSIVLNEQSPDSGRVLMERGMTFGYLPQESAPAGDETVMEMATKHAPENSGWEIEPKAQKILRGLAFRESDFNRPAKALSGGWIMRAHLARLLVQEPDLLLLDEPTNHLDLESLLWFQDYLKNYPGAILIISHDREFLNSLLRKVVEIAWQRLHFYNGNYDDFVREKAARAEQHLAAYENQQREIARLQDFADRFRAKASKAAQAQSKLKQIERMEKIEAPLEQAKTVGFRFPQPQRSGQRVMTLKDINFSYGTLEVYRGMELEVERGQRTVLVGPNGAGKSTLLKILAGVIVPQSGQRILGHNVKCGYFAQNRVETLQPNRSVLAEAMDLEVRQPEQFVRTLLGSFLFSGEDVFKPVAVLSGGEKSRLALCKLLLDPPNFLLLDEPTTHLDMASIESLIGALKSFEGTIVFISHDVHFIRSIAKTVIHISAGKLTPYAGDYQYYLDKSKATSEVAALTSGQKLQDLRPSEAPAAAEAPKEKVFLTREERKTAGREREARLAARRNLKGRVEQLERDIAKLEERQRVISGDLERPETYDNSSRAMELNRELMGITESLERLTAEWEEGLAEIERLTKEG